MFAATDRFRIGTLPGPMKRHNAVSWNELLSVLEARGGTATFEELVTAAIGHQSGTKRDHGLPPRLIAERFVKYCAKSKNGWLVRVR